MKAVFKILVISLVLSLLSACSLFGFGPNLTRDVDPDAIFNLLNETDMEDIFAPIESDYLPITQEVDMTRSPSLTTKISEENPLLTSTGLFTETFQEEGTKEIETGEMQYHFEGVLHPASGIAYGNGEKQVLRKGYDQSTLRTEFPLLFEEDTYINPNTDESMPFVFFLHKLQGLDNLGEPETSYGLTDSKDFFFTFNDEDEFLQFFGEIIPMDYESFKHATLSITTTQDENFFTKALLTIDWTSIEKGEEVDYRLSNQINLTIGVGLQNKQASLEDLFQALKDDQAFYHQNK